MQSSTTCTSFHAGMCILLVKMIPCPIVQVRCPTKSSIWRCWIGIFKPISQNIQNFVLLKLLLRFKPNLALWKWPPSTLCWLIQNAPHKSKMAAISHLEKMKNCNTLATIWLVWWSVHHIIFWGCIDIPPNICGRMPAKLPFFRRE